MEFAGPAPVGPSAALAAEMPLRKPRDVRQIEPGSRSGDTAPDTGQNRDNGPEARAARDVAALRREAERRNLPAGPTPAFEVSQLELEADIQHVIARVEAARSQARDAGALKAAAEAEARVAEAEYERLAESDARDMSTDVSSGGPGDAVGGMTPSDPEARPFEGAGSPDGAGGTDSASAAAPRPPSMNAFF